MAKLARGELQIDQDGDRALEQIGRPYRRDERKRGDLPSRLAADIGAIGKAVAYNSLLPSAKGVSRGRRDGEWRCPVLY